MEQGRREMGFLGDLERRFALVPSPIAFLFYDSAPLAKGLELAKPRVVELLSKVEKNITFFLLSSLEKPVGSSWNWD